MEEWRKAPSLEQTVNFISIFGSFHSANHRGPLSWWSGPDTLTGEWNMEEQSWSHCLVYRFTRPSQFRGGETVVCRWKRDHCSISTLPLSTSTKCQLTLPLSVRPLGIKVTGDWWWCNKTKHDQTNLVFLGQIATFWPKWHCNESVIKN